MPPWLLLLVFLVQNTYSHPINSSIEESGYEIILETATPLTETILPVVTRKPILLKEPEDTKWWCGNNTFSRGLAHFIAKHDSNIKNINECCRKHDFEYDEARTFQEVQISDTRFDECLGQDSSTYRQYVVRPLFNTAINMNYFFERVKSAFKSVFLGGDGFIDLK